MIPIKLTLRNFMCYRDNVPPISFEGLHTACISGNNGNGKSAIIDAITWALWGQTRAASDDDIIHSGQTEAEVDFEFSLGQLRYRIIRRHSRPKTQKGSGQTILEFQVASPEGYKVLSGDTTTQTQKKITQLLRMDYETFVNSAFLRQGRADEFTKKRPGERKQVLSNILQLSIYDELEDQAKELEKEQEALIMQLETAIKGFQEELARKSAYQAELDRYQSELAEAESIARRMEDRLTSLRRDKSALDGKRSQLAELSAGIKETERNYHRWNEQAQQFQSRIKTYEDLIAQRSLIEENYQRLVDTRRRFQDNESRFKRVSGLTQARHKLEMAIIKAGEDLNRDHAVTENRIREMEIVAGKLPRILEDLKELTARLRQMEESETELREKQEKSKLLRARVHFLQAEKVRLTQEIAQVDEKLKMLSHQSGVTCPLCETELGHDGQKRIESKYLAEKGGKTEALKVNQSELTLKEAEVRSLETDILKTEAGLKRRKELAQNQRGNLEKAAADARESEEKIILEKTRLGEIEKRLASRDFAVAEQESLLQLDREIAAIGYDPREHELLRLQLADCEGYEAPYHKLEEAVRQIAQDKEGEARARSTAQELKSRMESDILRQKALVMELESSDAVSRELVLAEKEYQDLSDRLKHLREITGGAKARLERLNDLEARSKEKEAQVARAVKQEKIYKDLAVAFGKKGIQAMLIEMAIPEIESEANKLLARMTDNRMHIKMETQRETRKGDVMETLDINISDELGTRNYEMFSGGEAFRIDFAIRVALSKILARRAGAPLPTLIIDEGFGTQDSMGIEKIKEAITSIQDDFEKILVITHIADFKDAFPMRIEVVKTSEGSSVYLN